MKLILDVQEKTDQKVKELMEEERKQIQQHTTVEKFWSTQKAPLVFNFDIENQEENLKWKWIA